MYYNLSENIAELRLFSKFAELMYQQYFYRLPPCVIAFDVHIKALHKSESGLYALLGPAKLNYSDIIEESNTSI